jgi:hypothetical protein
LVARIYRIASSDPVLHNHFLDITINYPTEGICIST